MPHTRHMIHRQSVEVAFEGPGERPGIQDRLAAVYDERVLPELDKLFNEFGAESNALTVPQLLIDCGVLHEANWEDELTASICNSIRDELRQYQTEPMARRWGGELIHFLQTGRFQWDSRKTLPADYDAQILLDPSFLNELTFALRASGETLKRLFHYCTANFIVRLAKALAEGRIPTTDVTYKILMEREEITEAVWATAVVTAYQTAYCRPLADGSADSLFVTTLIKKIWSHIDSIGRAKVVEQLIKNIGTNSDTELQASFDSGFLASILSLISDEFPRSATTIRKHISSGLRSTPEPLAAKNVSHLAKETDVPGEPHPDTAYYIANAGLILAYPFFAPLLQSNGLLGADQQLSQDARCKAATLFQYLVYESPVLTDESELPLNKVLAGLLPTTFVDPSLFGPTEHMQHECDALLASIITHWDVLRNTSSAALRETFLQREGKLTAQTSGWLLQVSASGVDVLLARLPWPIAIIKLPWMDHILRVEWT